METVTTPRREAMKSVGYGMLSIGGAVAGAAVCLWLMILAPWSDELRHMLAVIATGVVLALMLAALVAIAIVMGYLALLVGYMIYMAVGYGLATLWQAITNRPSTWKPWEPRWLS